MKKKLLTLIGLLSASAVASMCVIPHVNYNQDVAKTNISSIRNNINSRTIHNPLEIAYEEFGKIGSSDEMPYSEVGVFKKGTSFNVGDVIIAHGQGFSLIDVRSSFQELGFSSGMGVADVEELKSAILEKYPGDSAIEEKIDDLADEQTFEYYYYCKKACTVSVEPDYPTSYYKVPSSTVDNHIKDVTPPTNTGTNNFIVNVNNMLTIEKILEQCSAVDETDGPVQVKYTPEGTTYNPENRQLGKFVIKAYAEDKAGNRNSFDITVTVTDIDKPVLSGTQNYEQSYDDPITLETIKSAITVSDNYDSELELQVIQDNYTGHERELGAKTITFKAVDSSKNESDVFTVTINVYDKKPPVISGAESIKVANNAPIDLETFKSKFTINDDLDGSITDFTVEGFDAYLAKKDVVGTYPVTIKAKDKSNNEISKSVNIIVEDRMAPDVILNDYFIILEQGSSLTEEQIREYASKVLGITKESITEVNGIYDTNYVGNYKLSVKTITGDVYSFSLNVGEKSNQYEIVELNWWNRIWKGFSILFGNEDGYKAEGFIDWFKEIPERAKLCWNTWITGTYELRNGYLHIDKEENNNQEEVESEVAFKNTVQIENYIIEF